MISPVNELAAFLKHADNYTQDSREWPDPTEPRASKPPLPQGCTCIDGHKLDCPVHGLDGVDDMDHSWSMPQAQPVGYPQDGPRSYQQAMGSTSRIAGKEPKPDEPEYWQTEEGGNEYCKWTIYKEPKAKAASDSHRGRRSRAFGSPQSQPTARHQAQPLHVPCSLSPWTLAAASPRKSARLFGYVDPLDPSADKQTNVSPRSASRRDRTNRFSRLRTGLYSRLQAERSPSPAPSSFAYGEPPTLSTSVTNARLADSTKPPEWSFLRSSLSRTSDSGCSPSYVGRSTDKTMGNSPSPRSTAGRPFDATGSDRTGSAFCPSSGSSIGRTLGGTSREALAQHDPEQDGGQDQGDEQGRVLRFEYGEPDQHQIADDQGGAFHGGSLAGFAHHGAWDGNNRWPAPSPQNWHRTMHLTEGIEKPPEKPPEPPSPPSMPKQASSTLRVYHGTTNRALELAKQRGAFHTRPPMEWASEVAQHYGLDPQELHDHPYFQFSKDRAQDNKIYTHTDPKVAWGYAGAGSEQLEDALGAAHRMLHPDMYRDAEVSGFSGVGNYGKEVLEPHREAFRQAYKTTHQIEPTIVPLDVPTQVLGDQYSRQADAGYEPSGTFTIPTPVPTQWIGEHPDDYSGWGFQYTPRQASMTRNQYLRQMAELEGKLGPDRSPVIHRFDNGYSIATPMRAKDIMRTGQLLGNCWQGGGANGAHVLRDQDQIPRMAWNVSRPHMMSPNGYGAPNGMLDYPTIQEYPSVKSPSGHNNSPPKPEYLDMLHQYSQTLPIPYHHWVPNPQSVERSDQYQLVPWEPGDPDEWEHAASVFGYVHGWSDQSRAARTGGPAHPPLGGHRSDDRSHSPRPGRRSPSMANRWASPASTSASASWLFGQAPGAPVDRRSSAVPIAHAPAQHDQEQEQGEHRTNDCQHDKQQAERHVGRPENGIVFGEVQEAHADPEADEQGGGDRAGNQFAAHRAIIARDAKGDELCVLCDLPDSAASAIHKWASEHWSEDDLEDPSDYHITIMYTPNGHDEHAQADWLEHRAHDCKVAALRLFPSKEHGEKHAVVLALNSPSAKAHATALQDKAEHEHGLEITHFPGGYKPHITVAYVDSEELAEIKPPSIAFTSKRSRVSAPRTAGVASSFEFNPDICPYCNRSLPPKDQMQVNGPDGVMLVHNNPCSYAMALQGYQRMEKPYKPIMAGYPLFDYSPDSVARYALDPEHRPKLQLLYRDARFEQQERDANPHLPEDDWADAPKGTLHGFWRRKLTQPNRLGEWNVQFEQDGAPGYVDHIPLSNLAGYRLLEGELPAHMQSLMGQAQPQLPGGSAAIDVNEVQPQAKLAAMTRAQLLAWAANHEQAHGPDQSQLMHQFPDGWSIRSPATQADLNREGMLMGNCVGEQDFEPEEIGGTYHSLRDPENLPHATWYGDGMDRALGRHNGPVKPEYQGYLALDYPLLPPSLTPSSRNTYRNSAASYSESVSLSHKSPASLEGSCNLSRPQQAEDRARAIMAVSKAAFTYSTPCTDTGMLRIAVRTPVSMAAFMPCGSAPRHTALTLSPGHSTQHTQPQPLTVSVTHIASEFTMRAPLFDHKRVSPQISWPFAGETHKNRGVLGSPYAVHPLQEGKTFGPLQDVREVSHDDARSVSSIATGARDGSLRLDGSDQGSDSLHGLSRVLPGEPLHAHLGSSAGLREAGQCFGYGSSRARGGGLRGDQEVRAGVQSLSCETQLHSGTANWAAEGEIGDPGTPIATESLGPLFGISGALFDNGGDPIVGDLFHAAPTTERARILQHGLQPSAPYFSPQFDLSSNPDRWKGFHPEGVYGMPDPGRARSWGTYWHGNQGTDVWRIPAQSIQERLPDPELHSNFGAMVIPHAVQPEFFEGPEDRQEEEPSDIRFWGQDDPQSKQQYGLDHLRRQWGIGLPDRVIGRTASTRSLYHGTLRDHLPSIRQHGLIPQVGPFVTDAYDVAPEGEEPREGQLGHDDMEPAVYMTDKQDLDRALTAMRAQVARKLGLDFHDVNETHLRNHGLLAKLPGEMGFGGDPMTRANDGGDWDEQPPSAEEGDYFDTSGVPAQGLQLIHGPAMMRVFNRAGLLPLANPRGPAPSVPQEFRQPPAQQSWDFTNPQTPEPSQWAYVGKVADWDRVSDWYHAAPTTERERIRQHGLQVSDPRQNPQYYWNQNPDRVNRPPQEEMPPGVYVTPNIDRANSFGRRWHDDPDIWRVPAQEHELIADPDGMGYYLNRPVENPELLQTAQDSWERGNQDLQERTVQDQMKTYEQNKGAWGIGRQAAGMQTDPLTCMSCGSPLSEPFLSVDGSWKNSCPSCRGTFQIPSTSPMLKQWQSEWGSYPQALKDVATPQPWQSLVSSFAY